jgi:hypothetical protein
VPEELLHTTLRKWKEENEKQAARIRELQTLILMRYSTPAWQSVAAWAGILALLGLAFAAGWICGG